MLRKRSVRWGSAVQTVSSAVFDSERSPSRSRWILGDLQDFAVIIAAPLLVFVGVDRAIREWTGREISRFVIVCAYGHHLPGMMRAYGDRELLDRFRFRFVLAPIALLLVCVTATNSGNSGIHLPASAWG